MPDQRAGGTGVDTDADRQVRDAGFYGYVGCPEEDGCPTPFKCSERGDCPWDHEVCVLDDYPCSHQFCPVRMKRLLAAERVLTEWEKEHGQIDYQEVPPCQ